MAAHSGTRAIVAALGANLGIAATKFIAWALTGSSSMLAEGVHSVADSSNQGLLLLGQRRGKKQATPLHQFGYARVRYIYAFLVSIVLFTLGGLFALYEAWHKFQHPTAIASWKWVPVAVLLIAIVLEGRSFLIAKEEAKKARGTRSLTSYVRTSRSPEIPVILLEDAAALIGLVVALAGVSMTLITGDGRWDAIGSATIGCVLVAVALFLASEIGSMLVGESADDEVTASICAALAQGERPLELIDLRTMHLGPDDLLIAAKFSTSANVTGDEIAATINSAEARIRAAVTHRCAIYLEPDIPPRNY
ncbi:MAG: cation diffusion facilitator family transporter [Actinomycetaceae bacterium]|nr:cation diffusion facilitator family transporter [Actinomycetaceae bacterium]